MVAKAKEKDPKKSEKKAASTAKDKDVMSRREKRTIPVKLTDAEISKFATQHVETLDKIAAKEEEKKTADAAIKGDIALLEEADAKLVSILRTKSQERELEVDVVYDWRTNEVRVVRVDTGEEVTKRAMSYEERQREMFSVDHKKDKGEVKNAKGKDGKPADRKQPQPHDVIDVETIEGWKRGKVLPSSGSMLDVDVGDGKIEHAPVEGQTWRWPDEVGENSAPAKNLPKVGDRIQAKSYDGWEEGKVSKVDGGLMTVDLGEDECTQVDMDSDDWRWPEKLKASMGEQVEAKGKSKGKKKSAKGDDDIPPMPGEEGLDF